MKWKKPSAYHRGLFDLSFDLMDEIHHRMTVILHREDYGKWLDPDFDEQEPLRSLLKTYSSDKMEAIRVSRRVNKPANNEPGCIQSAA